MKTKIIMTTILLVSSLLGNNFIEDYNKALKLYRIGMAEDRVSDLIEAEAVLDKYSKEEMQVRPFSYFLKGRILGEMGEDKLEKAVEYFNYYKDNQDDKVTPSIQIIYAYLRTDKKVNANDIVETKYINKAIELVNELDRSVGADHRLRKDVNYCFAFVYNRAAYNYIEAFAYRYDPLRVKELGVQDLVKEDIKYFKNVERLILKARSKVDELDLFVTANNLAYTYFRLLEFNAMLDNKEAGDFYLNRLGEVMGIYGIIASVELGDNVMYYERFSTKREERVRGTGPKK